MHVHLVGEHKIAGRLPYVAALPHVLCTNKHCSTQRWLLWWLVRHVHCLYLRGVYMLFWWLQLLLSTTKKNTQPQVGNVAGWQADWHRCLLVTFFGLSSSGTYYPCVRHSTFIFSQQLTCTATAFTHCRCVPTWQHFKTCCGGTSTAQHDTRCTHILPIIATTAQLRNTLPRICSLRACHGTFVRAAYTSTEVATTAQLLACWLAGWHLSHPCYTPASFTGWQAVRAISSELHCQRHCVANAVECCLSDTLAAMDASDTPAKDMSMAVCGRARMRLAGWRFVSGCGMDCHRIVFLGSAEGERIPAPTQQQQKWAAGVAVAV